MRTQCKHALLYYRLPRRHGEYRDTRGRRLNLVLYAGDRSFNVDSRPSLACLAQSPALNSFQLLCTCRATGYVAACAAQSSSVPGGSVALCTAAANAAAAESIRPFIQQAWSFCTTGEWATQQDEPRRCSLASDISALPCIKCPPSVYEPHTCTFSDVIGKWDGAPPW